MIPYFITYIFFMVMSLSSNKKLTSNKILWNISCIYLVFYIGLRHQVGGDWWTYLSGFEDVNNLTIEFILLHSDIGYHFINLVVSDLNLSIHIVNLICAIIFVYGLVKFAKCENNKWLIIVIALPYTVNIVAMGYTRQAVALGLILLSIVALREKKLFRFIIIIIIAATFHKTAIILMGLGIFTSGKGKLIKIIAIILIGIGVFQVFLSQQIDSLIVNYVDAQMQSEGAKIRTFMNLIPAIILILLRKRWKENFDDFQLWFIISILSIISFAIVDYASTAVDRIALYFLPIQMIVFGRLHILLKNKIPVSIVNLSIAIYYFLVLFVWLVFAKTAFAWIPYQNILFYDLF